MLHKASSLNPLNKPRIPYSPTLNKENPFFLPPLLLIEMIELSIVEGSVSSEIILEIVSSKKHFSGEGRVWVAHRVRITGDSFEDT